MKNSPDLQPIFILHSRPYRDTSLLLDCLSRDEGRISLVAKGAKRDKSPLKGILQPFTPILASWFGRGDLQTLKSAESNGPAYKLTGQTLFCGFYINELLIRLLHRHDPHPDIFDAYSSVIASAARQSTAPVIARNEVTRQSSSNKFERELRIFEKTLLAELGYALQIESEVNTHEPIKPKAYYHFIPDQGCILTSSLRAKRGNPVSETVSQRDAQSNTGLPRHVVPRNDAKGRIFKGSTLIAIAQNDFEDKETLKDAKRLIRLALMPLLGDKPLKSRELFGSTVA